MKVPPNDDNDNKDRFPEHLHKSSTDRDIQRQEAMINDLIQLTRLQNNEINSLRQEVRRISTSATTMENNLRDELGDLKTQIAALRNEQQQQQIDRKGRESSSLGGGGDGVTAPPLLTRKAHVGIRDSQTIKNEIIAAVKKDISVEFEQKQGTSMHAVKTQLRELERLMGSVLAGVGCLYKSLMPPLETHNKLSSLQHCYYDLEQEALGLVQDVTEGRDTSEATRISTQQILLYQQFSSLAEALTRCVATKSDENIMPADMHSQFVNWSETVDRQMRRINTHTRPSPCHTGDFGGTQACMYCTHFVLEMCEAARHESRTLRSQMRELRHKVTSSFDSSPYSPPWSSSENSTVFTPHNDNNDCVEQPTELTTTVESNGQTMQELKQRVDSLEHAQEKHKKSLFSHSRDLHNLQRRLIYAEAMIGGLYRPGDISVKGRSFYLDAAALRYTPSTRGTFTKFYGNRAGVAPFVDIAPPVVLLAFHAVARVRCSHAIWEDNLELKQAIRRVAEDIIDMWVTVLPLCDGDEHLTCPDRTLVGAGNHLKLLCRRAKLDLEGQ